MKLEHTADHQLELVGQNKVNKRKILIAALTVFCLSATVYTYNYFTETLKQAPSQTTIQNIMDNNVAAGCILTTGCTSNACVGGKQWKFNSSGQKQCCKC